MKKIFPPPPTLTCLFLIFLLFIPLKNCFPFNHIPTMFIIGLFVSMYGLCFSDQVQPVYC